MASRATSLRQYKVAVIQASAVYHDAAAGLVQTIRLLEDAAANGAKLIVFPELWLGAYPFFIWMIPYGEMTPLIKEYYVKGAVEADGPEARQLREACVRLQIRAVVGFAERDHGSLYMSQWIFGPDGSVVVRRKLKPSIMERIVFGEGDGSDIRVFETELGRVGALQCWEHCQPLLKYAMAVQHEEVHCASWPSFPPALPHFSLSAETNASVIQTYAVETGSFVISSSMPVSLQNQDYIAQGREHLREHFPLGGAMSQIYDPEGRQLCVRPAHDVETILYADIDLNMCYSAKGAMDPVGHYARSDVFDVHFNNSPRQPVRVGAHGSQKCTPGATRQLRRELFPASECSAARPTAPTFEVSFDRIDKESATL